MNSHFMQLLFPVGTFCAPPTRPTFSGVWLYGDKCKRLNFDIRRGSTSKPRFEDNFQQNGLPTAIKWQEILGHVAAIGEEARKASTEEEIIKHIKAIKAMLCSMEDGGISVSAYDTAWVALVKDVEGSGAPQFPSSLQWIANNQLPDGSWGDSNISQAHDRLLSTLACLVALKSWNLHPDKYQKGMAYFRENLHWLEEENPEHMPVGFEFAFPSLLVLAKTLNIDIPNDFPVLKEIYAERNAKLQCLPMDVMHKIPTTLLCCLEALPGLDWEKLLKLQNKDGSFLFSPCSTAYALMQTKDSNCLRYLNRVVVRFNGGAPSTYPFDLFEHLWTVDRLQRLGISRFFDTEIKECINYVKGYWTENGIGWARNCPVYDIDDTAMGFRLMRLHGYDVSPDIFKQFEKDGRFVGYIGESTHSITVTFNLYRASQVLFPGEKILHRAREFSSNFLLEKLDANQLHDKWIITKDLPGEIRYALEVPWYANLPRVEARFFIEHYGGKDDVWISRTLYRMPYINNDMYLDLAKLDYNNCQDCHRVEWDNFQKWYEECNLVAFGISRKSLLIAYFTATASIFEPERYLERLSWAKTTTLLDAIDSYFDKKNNNNNIKQRKSFVSDFKNCLGLGHLFNKRRITKKGTGQDLVRLLVQTLNHLSLESSVGDCRDIHHSFCLAWEKWLTKWETGERSKGEAELLVQTILITAGHCQSHHLPEYDSLYHLINQLCIQLRHYQSQKVHDNNGRHDEKITTPEMEHGMQQLVQLVYQNSHDGLDPNIKQTFLMVAKTFYYIAYCDPGTINYHIARVLFDRVY